MTGVQTCALPISKCVTGRVLLHILFHQSPAWLSRQESRRSSDVTSDTTEDDVEHVDSEIGDISTADLFIIKSSFDSKSLV